MSHHYAIFSAQYAPHAGGVESFTQSLAHALAQGGDRVSVVTSRLDASAEHEVQADGVEVVRLPCVALMGGRLPISRRSAAYRQAVGELVRSDVDRVLVNTRFYRHSLEGLRFAKETGTPAVVLDHGSAYLVLGNRLADVALRVYEHGVTRLGRRYHARYAGISAASTQWLQTFGIKTSAVIPNAIDACAYRALASNRDVRAELAVRDDQLLVAFVGRLTPEKGAYELAQAMELLDERFVCAMAGEGFERERIEALRCGRVHLLGVLGKPDLSALLAQADAFCLPTRSEGYCTALLEAGAWGLVPIMPRVGGVDEIMGNPVRFGRVLDDREPATIARALQAMADAHALGHDTALAREVEENHSWQATVQALDHAFA